MSPFTTGTDLFIIITPYEKYSMLLYALSYICKKKNAIIKPSFYMSDYMLKRLDKKLMSKQID
ncbi:hypothetical protein PMEGAPL125_13480 [Priestia megaterium]